MDRAADSPAAGGRLVEERRFRIEPDGTPDEKTLFAYDELGRREAVIEYAGSMVAAARSSNYAYDPVTGGLATETTPEGPAVGYQDIPIVGILLD